MWRGRDKFVKVAEPAQVPALRDMTSSLRRPSAVDRLTKYLFFVAESDLLYKR